MPRRTESEWQQLLTEYQQSGLSQKVFCQQNKLCPKGLTRYRRRRDACREKASFVQVSRSETTEVDSVIIRVDVGKVSVYLPLDKPLQTAQLINALQ